MSNSAKSRAETQFTASQKKDQQVLKERERAEQERSERTARLRAIRLAKEAEDAVNADAKNDKPSPLPQTHRR